MGSRFSYSSLEIEDVRLIKPFLQEDDRGYFIKSIERDIYREWGLDADIYEVFETYSKKSVIRGLHFQTTNPQTKIVRVIKGEIRDVVVDLRTNSQTFGEYLAVNLSDVNHNILWIPKGFAHGFEVLSDEAIVSYSCVGKYMREYDTGIIWNDRDLAIEWKTAEPIVSEKDRNLQTFAEYCEKYSGMCNNI